MHLRTKGPPGKSNLKAEENAKEHFDSIKKKATSFKHVPLPKPLDPPSLVSELAHEASARLSETRAVENAYEDFSEKLQTSKEQQKAYDVPAVVSIKQALAFVGNIAKDEKEEFVRHLCHDKSLLFIPTMQKALVVIAAPHSGNIPSKHDSSDKNHSTLGEAEAVEAWERRMTGVDGGDQHDESIEAEHGSKEITRQVKTRLLGCMNELVQRETELAEARHDLQLHNLRFEKVSASVQLLYKQHVDAGIEFAQGGITEIFFFCATLI